MNKLAAMSNTYKDTNLTTLEKHLYNYLILNYNEQKGYAFPPYSDLQKKITKDRTKLAKLIKGLKEKGYIEVSKGVRGCNNYFLLKYVTSIDFNTSEKMTSIDFNTNERTTSIDFNTSTSIDFNTQYNNNIINIYDDLSNFFFNSLGKRINKSKTRLKKLNDLLQEHSEEEFKKALENILDSKYLKTNIEVDWFLITDNFIKVLEGYYKDKVKEVERVYDNIPSSYKHFNFDEEEEYSDEMKKIIEYERKRLDEEDREKLYGF